MITSKLARLPIKSPGRCQALFVGTGMLDTSSLQPSNQHLKSINCQQLRFVERRHKFLTDHYGLPPVLNEQEYIDLVEGNKTDELEYKNFRFVKIDENSSVLRDEQFERFVRETMKQGRKQLAYTIMEDCFYRIKCIQIPRWRKQQQRLAKKAQEAEANPNAATKSKVTASSTQSDQVKELLGQLAEDDEPIETNPLIVFHKALRNVQPIVITKPVRRGGATYQVPHPVPDSEGRWLAIKWLLQTVRERPRPRTRWFEFCMAQELIDASEGKGKVIKRRDDAHRAAEANKAFAHYRYV